MICGRYIHKLISQRKFKVKCGRGAFPYKSTFEGRNSIGENSEVAHSSVGFASYIADGSVIRRAKVGRYTSIGSGVRTGVGMHPVGSHFSTHPSFFNSEVGKRCGITPTLDFDEHKYIDSNGKFFVEIGSDVWIGNNVTIMDGIKIADGSIIGLGALVRSDTQPFGIYVGIPARLVRFRFSPEVIDKLISTSWWNHDPGWIDRNSRLLQSLVSA